MWTRLGWRAHGRCIAVAALLLAPQVAAAQDESFAGTWHIVDAEVAPWVEPDPTLLEDFERLRGATVTFLADQVEGPDPLGCGGATYTTGTVPPEGLFQGGLGEEQAGEKAAALGLTGDSFATLDVACDTGLFSYHLRDDGTVVFALSNVIYAMSREAPAEDAAAAE